MGDERRAWPWPLIGLAFFTSGASGLVLEVVWNRLFSTELGVGSLATAAVLAGFMGGLALGSWIAGWLAPRLRRPVAWYGAMEMGIGGLALLVPSMVDLLGPWRNQVRSWWDPPLWGMAVDMLTVLPAILPPTILMGATLPILARAIGSRGPSGDRSVGYLYALNTAGALSGTLLAGFVLLPTMGLWHTILLAAGANVTVGAAVLFWAARPTRTSPPEPPPDQRGITGSGPTLGPRVLIPGVALGSATAMAYQILWTRAMSVVLGSSTYSFTVVLAAVLTGLAAGGAVASSAVTRLRSPGRALGLDRLVVALAAAPALLFLDRLPDLVLWFLRRADLEPWVLVGFAFSVAALVVLPATVALGATFPLALAAAKPTGHDQARKVGWLYAASTVGALVGSAATGLLVLPWLGLRNGMVLVVTLDAFLAAWFLAGARSRAWVVALTVALALPVVSPTMDRGRFTSGLYRVSLVKEIYTDTDYSEPEQLLYEDGLAATITVERRGDVLVLKSNGKVEASNRADMPTQVLVALLPLILHPDPKDAMLIGLASGVTAGAALTTDIESLTVAELEPAMVDAARLFSAVNHSPLQDPRTTLVLDDGRNVLARADRTFDVIISEPSNPWIAGVASLFTREAFELAASRLRRPGGLFCQWLQLYEISPDDVRMVLRTFRSVFPHVLTFSSLESGVDLIMIGSLDPIRVSFGALDRALSSPRVAAEAARAHVRRSYDIMARLFLGPGELAKFAGDGPLNTDDHCRLEFSAPLGLVRYADYEDFFRDFYHGGRIHGRVEGLASDFTPDRVVPFSMALLAAGKFHYAKELAVRSRGVDPRDAARVATLADLCTEPMARLADPGDPRVVANIGCADGFHRERLEALLAQGAYAELRDTLARLPSSCDHDPGFLVLAAYSLYMDGLYESTIAALGEFAETPGGPPAAGFILGRALISLQRYREGIQWIQWALDAGLPTSGGRGPSPP